MPHYERLLPHAPGLSGGMFDYGFKVVGCKVDEETGFDLLRLRLAVATQNR